MLKALGMVLDECPPGVVLNWYTISFFSPHAIQRCTIGSFHHIRKWIMLMATLIAVANVMQPVFNHVDDGGKP